MRPSGGTIDDSFLTEIKNTQNRKLSQKQKTLVSANVLLETLMSILRPYLPSSLQPKSTMHLKYVSQSGFSPVKGVQLMEARSIGL